MPFPCPPCKMEFKDQKHLDKHLKYSPSHTRSSSQKQSGKSPAKAIPKSSSRNQAPQQAARASGSNAPQKQPLGHSTAASASSTLLTKQDTKGKESRYPHADSRWSVLPALDHDAVLHALSMSCHSLSNLDDNNFIIRPYDISDYADARKCGRCKISEMKALALPSQECTYHPQKRNKYNKNRPYKCCIAAGKGCQTLLSHDFQLPSRAIKHKDYRSTPAASIIPKFNAVVLDCEMAGVVGGASEVIQLCAIDYVTGAILVNRLVNPREKITQMRTDIHGISKTKLNAAVAGGQALVGWEGARAELWKYIDENTILVGHALENELDALRMIHLRVVDSGILARNAVGIPRIRWGLRTLCSELLEMPIRQNAGGIHDCMEDVLATREVALWCIQNRQLFQSWAALKNREETQREEEREKKRKQKEEIERQQGKGKQKAMGNGDPFNLQGQFDSMEEDEEILHWSDIAESMGYPHPDTGYYPWSD